MSPTLVKSSTLTHDSVDGVHAPRLAAFRTDRLREIAALRAKGIDPYPSHSARTVGAGTVRSQFETLQGSRVTVAGRLMAMRTQGSVAFGDLSDESGQTQVLMSRKRLPYESTTASLSYDDLSLVSRGDIIEAHGVVALSRRGEVSVEAEKIRILAKTLRPLPDKRKGLRDRGLLIRKRHLQMMLDPMIGERLRNVSGILQVIRQSLVERGFVEIQTPVLQPLYGGGRAKPFRTYVNALDQDFYLGISHELYLKRLLVGGMERVFTIGRYFRNEGVDRLHNPEFSMLETMTAYENYEYNMDLTEDLYRSVTTKVFGRTLFDVGDEVVDFGRPWQRLSMADAVSQFLGVDWDTVSRLSAANRVLAQHGLTRSRTVGEALVALFETFVSSRLVQPTILYGHPIEISPLAKAREDDARYAERFEVFIGGVEQGDNWTELNDPVELRRRFEQEGRRMRQGDREAHPLDADFLEAVEYGLPPSTGLGPGIERMAMLLSGATNIDDVLPFPLVRRRKGLDVTTRRAPG